MSMTCRMYHKLTCQEHAHKAQRWCGYTHSPWPNYWRTQNLLDNAFGTPQRHWIHPKSCSLHQPLLSWSHETVAVLKKNSWMSVLNALWINKPRRLHQISAISMRLNSNVGIRNVWEFLVRSRSKLPTSFVENYAGNRKQSQLTLSIQLLTYLAWLVQCAPQLRLFQIQYLQGIQQSQCSHGPQDFPEIVWERQSFQLTCSHQSRRLYHRSSQENCQDPKLLAWASQACETPAGSIPGRTWTRVHPSLKIIIPSPTTK